MQPLTEIYTFIINLMSFFNHPLTLILFVGLTFLFMFLQIAKILMQQTKSDEASYQNKDGIAQEGYVSRLLHDLPKSLFMAILWSLSFFILATILYFYRVATPSSYTQLNNYIKNNFEKSVYVEGTFIEDHIFKGIKSKNGKKKFQESLNYVYRDNKVTYAELKYLKKITEDEN